jgi:hypothetical protein
MLRYLGLVQTGVQISYPPPISKDLYIRCMRYLSDRIVWDAYHDVDHIEKSNPAFQHNVYIGVLQYIGTAR